MPRAYGMVSLQLERLQQAHAFDLVISATPLLSAPGAPEGGLLMELQEPRCFGTEWPFTMEARE
jgi:hypothetical protein